MWEKWAIDSDRKDFGYNSENKRQIITSSAGNSIYFSRGHKAKYADDYQVTIEFDDGVYGVKDSDYFRFLLTVYNEGQYSKAITDLLIEVFDGVTDMACRTTGNPGSDSNVIRATQKLQSKVLKIFNNYLYKEGLEEAVLILFLAMIAEWYYLNPRNGNRSVYQHRMKWLAIRQVLSGDLTPEEAADFSRSQPGDEKNKLENAFSKYGISSERVRLGTTVNLKNYYRATFK